MRKRLIFNTAERANWHGDKPINDQEPHANLNIKTGKCLFFANSVVIGKHRDVVKGPYFTKDKLLLPCLRTHVEPRCQSLDRYGLCPVRVTYLPEKTYKNLINRLMV